MAHNRLMDNRSQIILVAIIVATIIALIVFVSLTH